VCEGSDAMNMPFAIGDETWLPAPASQQVRVECPACRGTRVITFLYGGNVDPERVNMPCEACGLGFDGPRGYIEEWVSQPGATKYVIAEVMGMRSRDGETEWEVRSTEGRTAYFKDLCATEAEALAKSSEMCNEQEERNMLTRQRHKAGVKKHSWSALYHKQQIKDLERQIAWHRSRIGAK
jgi:hypothetical protein